MLEESEKKRKETEKEWRNNFFQLWSYDDNTDDEHLSCDSTVSTYIYIYNVKTAYWSERKQNSDELTL